MRQIVITPAAGKRLIGKAIAAHPAVKTALESGTVVIVAGTTNAYVAEEILAATGEEEEFRRGHFYRGITLPPAKPTTDSGRSPDESKFPGDVVLVNGKWEKGKEIFDVVDGLREGDVILKGANAVDLANGRAAILIGHPKAGTIGAALQAVAGRRVQLIVPVGVEKRIPGDLDELAAIRNAPGVTGPRLLPVPGEIVTELEAIELLTGVSADLLAAGGVGGAEGCVWLMLEGTGEQEEKAAELLKAIAGEAPFEA
jgi:hypothetical protein